MKAKKRLLSLLLCGAMVFSLCPQVVTAEGIQDSGKTIGGLCEHHPAHDENCGYAEGIPGTSCNHEHDEDCYKLVTECVHEHDEDCYPAEDVSDNTATPSDADAAEPTECDHECSEESGCITEELDCLHEHDEACGYSPAEPGTPCGYVCEICNAEGSGGETVPADPEEKPETECTCETLCTAEEANADCPVCGAEGADLTLCKGAEPETATPSEAEKSSVGEVQKLIDTLPTADELAAMSLEEQQAVYEKVQAAYDAYNALTDEQKAEVTGAEIFDSLFDVFNGMVNTLVNQTDYNISEGAVTIDDSCGNNCPGHTITGSSNTNTITVTGGNHHIILNGVNIDVSGIWEAGALYLDTAGICTITLQGSNVLKSGSDRPGIHVPANNKVTINGDGSLEVRGANSWPGIGRTGEGNIEIQSGTIHAYGGSNAAGIGGSFGFGGGTITITGGSVTANGGNDGYGGGAGIGGGLDGEGGTITITGGTVTANGGNGRDGRGSGIGGGCLYNGGLGGNGTFSTGNNGSAIIVASTISDQSGKESWNGIIVENNKGKVYGDQTLEEDWTIPADMTVEVPSDTTLTVDATLTVHGTLKGDGTLIVSGTGTLAGTGTVSVKKQVFPQKTSVIVTFEDIIGDSVDYGSTITLTATISKAANALNRAAANQVEFFVGTGNNKTSLGTVNVNGTSATKQITLSGDTWKPGTYTITAEYGGSDTLKEATGSSTLTVTAAKLSAPQNLTWDSTAPGKATWNAVTNASGYSVQLYKDGTAQGNPVSVTGTSHTFTITEAGSYTFKVKATGTGNYADSPESAATSSLTFYAVTFDTDGGSTIAPQIVVSGSKVTTPTTPTKTGHTFENWYSDNGLNTPYDFDNSTITTATTIYAKWTVNSYNVTLNANGGTINSGNITSYTYGVGATLPAAGDMTYTGHTFKGWYADGSFSGSPVTEISATDTGAKAYYAKWLSTDAGVTAVSVDNTAGTINGTTITVVLPFGTASLPTENSKVSITQADGATVSNLDTADNGNTWTFTVTAEDGQTTKNYTISVSIAPDPATGNRNDIAAAKSTVEKHDWTVPQATANTEEAVKTWIEGQLAAMELNGASYTVTMTGSFAAATAGTDEDRDGTNGSFAFTVKLYKGNDTGNIATSTYAEATVTISNGAVTATPYTKWTVTVNAGDGGSVSGGGTFEENTQVTVTATPNSGYHFVRWTENGAEVSTSASYSFTLTADRTLTAVFGRNSSGDGGGSTPTYSRRTLTQNGVSVTGNQLHRSATLTVTKNKLHQSGTCGDCDQIRAWQEQGRVVAIYDVSLNGDFKGSVTITFPVPASYNGEVLTVAHCIDGELETYDVTATNGKVEVTVDSLSPFAILEDEDTDPGKENPSTGADNPFTDVKETDWFFQDVMYVYYKGLMMGTSDTTFSPHSDTTRAMMAAIFYRMDGSPAVEGRNSFTDVPYGPGTAWYYDAVTWAQQTGIMAGYGGGIFKPDDPVTREQLALIFYNYAKYKGCDLTLTSDLSGFTDADDISAWAQDAMKWAVGSGILAGKGNGILDPQGNATRAEIAAMLHRFVAKNEQYLVLPGGTTGTGGTASGGGTGVSISPQTGDSNPIGLWISLCLLSLSGIAALLILKRREDEDEAKARQPV